MNTPDMWPMCLTEMTDWILAAQEESGLCMANPTRMADIVAVSKTTSAIKGIHNNRPLYSILPEHLPSRVGRLVNLYPGKMRKEVNVDAHRSVQMIRVVRERKWLGIAWMRRRNNHELHGMMTARRIWPASSNRYRMHEVGDNAAY